MQHAMQRWRCHNVPMSDQESIAEWMRAVLAETGWTAGEWARRAKTSATNITRLIGDPEGSSVPRIDTIRKLISVVPPGGPELQINEPGAYTPDRPQLAPALSEYVAVPRYDASLSAGPGSILDPNTAPLGHSLFEAQWLAAITRAAGDMLAVVRVDGDSMEPTLADGDWILIDRTQRRINRQGVYAIQVGDVAWIKRISLNLKDKLVQVISDNEHYPMQELAEDELAVIGRAVWIVGRKV